MAITTTTTQTQLKSSFIRMDAEFFRPEHVIAYKHIEGISGGNSLGRLCDKITQGSNPHFSEGGFPCVNGKNVYFGTMQEGEPNYVSAQEFKRLEGYRLRHNDIVVTLKHATKVGRAWIVEDDKPRVFSRNIGLIRLSKDSSIKASLLLLYLWTRSGQLCLERCATGGTSGQITLPISELKHIPLPTFPEQFQLEIQDMFYRSRTALLISERAYAQAQQLLKSELGLDKLRFQKPMGYAAWFSELESSRRSDAEFFNPELRYFQREIAKKHSLKSITEYALILKFSNPPYGSDGVPIITQKHLGKISPDKYGDDLVAQDSWVTSNLLAVLRKNDLLYYSVGAYLGKTNLWLSDVRAVHASFITMLRCHDKANAGFLQVLLNSTYGILQSKCFQSGTSQPYIYPKDIRRFLVPDVPVSLRQKIHNLVLESYEKAEESKRLLDQAKTRVEQLIEDAVKS